MSLKTWVDGFQIFFTIDSFQSLVSNLASRNSPWPSLFLGETSHHCLFLHVFFCLCVRRSCVRCEKLFQYFSRRGSKRPEQLFQDCRLTFSSFNFFLCLSQFQDSSLSPLSKCCWCCQSSLEPIICCFLLEFCYISSCGLPQVYIFWCLSWCVQLLRLCSMFRYNLVFPTREEALGAEEADTKPQDGQFVQAGDDIFGEGQQAGEPVQLRVQAVAVAFGWVGLGAFSWCRFDSFLRRFSSFPSSIHVCCWCFCLFTVKLEEIHKLLTYNIQLQTVESSRNLSDKNQ